MRRLTGLIILGLSCTGEVGNNADAGGGSAAGGSVAGGSTAGGFTAGGSTAGGSTAGGATAGGATAGGSTAGGSTAGGATAGGATAGGTTAGGTTAGGTTAGGSTAGGGARPDGGSAVDAGPPLDAGYFVCPPAPDAGPTLATVAAQLQRGEWRQLNAPGWTRDLLYTDCNGGGGSTAHTDWSDELFWDQRTQTARFLGAGHLRAFGFVFFSANSNTWCRDDVGLHACLRSTGYSRCFTHAYDHQAFDPGRSQLMLLTAGREILRYDVATRGWSFDAPPTPIGGGYGQVLEFFPARDALFHAVSSTGVFISRTNVVTNLPSMPGVGPYHNTATSLPHHRALLYGGGNSSKRLYVVREDAGVTQVPDITFPSGVTDQIHTAYTTLTYDPIDGDALLLSEEGTFHALELATLTWRRLPDPPWRGRSGYSHALATPIDDHQVVLFAFPQSAYSVWLYKP